MDIVGGNDPPVSSHSPVEIEKDIANRNSKCSSSSSSSGESGSSSSGSCICIPYMYFLDLQFIFNFLIFGKWSVWFQHLYLIRFRSGFCGETWYKNLYTAVQLLYA